MVRCPICGSRDVTKLKTGSYKCNSCGFVFYPSRDAIIDMRDLLSAEELTEEEINEIGERMKESTESLGRRVFGKEVKNIFRAIKSLDDILAQYNEEDRVFGIFVDFEGNIKGTFLIMIHENDLDHIKTMHNENNSIRALKIFGREAAEAFRENFKNNIEVEKIDVAYDTIPSMINYLISDISGDRSLMFLNVKMIVDKAPKGEIIFVPQKESIRYLKNIINE